MTARGNADALALGPGYLYWSVLGSTEPTDLATAWASIDADWIALGYTNDGSEFHSQTAVDAVEVAEELQEIDSSETGREESVVFSLAQMTAQNLKVAFNGGNITTGTGIIVFEPPDLGASVKCMLAWEAEDHTERWVWRQCKQVGEINIPRAKGAAKAVIPCTFRVQKPATGLRAWKAILAAPKRQ